MLSTLQRGLRGLTHRSQRRRFDTRLAREVQWCASAGGALSLILLALPGTVPGTVNERLLDRTVNYLTAVHPGAVVSRLYGSVQIGILLPGAGVARAQQVAQQLRRPAFGLGEVGAYLVACSQGVAGWDPTLDPAGLLRRAEYALVSAVAGNTPVVLYHDGISPRGVPGPHIQPSL